VRFGRDSLDRMAFTMNVSLAGAYIRTNHVFPPGTTIKVEFNFPQRSLETYAKVVWAKQVPPQMAHLLPCGMGVRLIEPGPDWIAAFDAWEAARSVGGA